MITYGDLLFMRCLKCGYDTQPTIGSLVIIEPCRVTEGCLRKDCHLRAVLLLWNIEHGHQAQDDHTTDQRAASEGGQGEGPRGGPQANRGRKKGSSKAPGSIPLQKIGDQYAERHYADRRNFHAVLSSGFIAGFLAGRSWDMSFDIDCRGHQLTNWEELLNGIGD